MFDLILRKIGLDSSHIHIKVQLISSWAMIICNLLTETKFWCPYQPWLVLMFFFSTQFKNNSVFTLVSIVVKLGSAQPQLFAIQFDLGSSYYFHLFCLFRTVQVLLPSYHSMQIENSLVILICSEFPIQLKSNREILNSNTLSPGQEEHLLTFSLKIENYSRLWLVNLVHVCGSVSQFFFLRFKQVCSSEFNTSCGWAGPKHCNTLYDLARIFKKL